LSYPQAIHFMVIGVNSYGRSYVLLLKAQLGERAHVLSFNASRGPKPICGSCIPKLSTCVDLEEAGYLARTNIYTALSFDDRISSAPVSTRGGACVKV